MFISPENDHAQPSPVALDHDRSRSPALCATIAAQTDAMHLAYVSTANQVGVMEYCMSKGWADEAAVDAQKKAVANLPPTTDRTSLTEAEATGRRGELTNNGTTISLASMAQRGNTTEQDLCTRMISAAKMLAAQRSSMPAMPAMPGGGAMPSLPPGMTMPSTPGMSKTP